MREYMNKMFCFQCEQTFKGTGCTTAGVCGKNAVTATEQDTLLSELVALVSEVESTPEVKAMVRDALFLTVTNVNFDVENVQLWIKKVQALRSSKDTPVFQLNNLWTHDEDVRSLKSLLLFGLKGMAAYAHHAATLGFFNEQVDVFFVQALKALAYEHTLEELLELNLACGRVNLLCMELLDSANTQTYGHPIPTPVTTIIEPGPFIIITGHDLHDLFLLLQQTEGKGINIYTHGEMLPAHAYPQLKAFAHLKGNFGTAWQNQQTEFDHVPAPILYTTNCLMPVNKSYADRVFTTSVVAYPELKHLGDSKDFSPVIAQALALGGYPTQQKHTGINGGTELITGFGHNTVLNVAEKVVAAVKAKELRHIFLIGGCDGAAVGRNYYTHFAQQTPANTLMLTLACGKFRFNDIAFGMINDLPRLMDMGQCNDAYSAIKVAVALAEAFGCRVNELPLTMVLSWYEQKAVVILLTLLALGIKNIYLGPSLPVFLSPNVLNILVDKWQIKAISTPEADLKAILR
jgi:hydroxylamine reductase